MTEVVIFKADNLNIHLVDVMMVVVNESDMLMFLKERKCGKIAILTNHLLLFAP